MANSVLGWGIIGTGTYYANVDTTATTLELGQAATSNAGSYIVTLQGTGFTGSVKAQLVAPGAAASPYSITPDIVGLVNLNDFTEIDGDTGATADGSYRFNADHGMMASLLVTVSAGSVKIVVRKGDG